MRREHQDDDPAIVLRGTLPNPVLLAEVHPPAVPPPLPLRSIQVPRTIPESTGFLLVAIVLAEAPSPAAHQSAAPPPPPPPGQAPTRPP
ncbi:MAG: hypothetical protein RMJ98_20000, partial [Myxococcales bacterium]|nr:hypothetical protein [Myxococcales bacterium]